ncbi:2-amino-4-hydroxy-6-hydroxymethyldihydropteridine diphosphokinase [Falsibacillus pallidus]|uniref:2-amino-4-hydroxy-6- hydroxymethyldihydropteridine diphosphokinase n=1 Tax=Falsibacillus pallidus TaxID=493781 RepID=UPI003D9664A0
MTNQAYLSLGSNIGAREAYLQKAIHSLHVHPEIRVEKISSIYETDPVGYTDQGNFLNMAIQVETSLTAEQLLSACLETELELGRKRDIKWGPRTIDLDILLYNNENIETEKLIIPHPRMAERAFVLIPLLEINPEPLRNGAPFTQVLNEIPDKEGVRLWKQTNGEDVFGLLEN